MTEDAPPPQSTTRWYSILGFQFSRPQAIRGAKLLAAGGIAFCVAFSAWYIPPRATSRSVRSVGGSVNYRPEQMSNFPFARFFHSQSQMFGFTATDEEVDFVQLTQSTVTDAWLHHLQPLEELRHLSIHERQLGPGLAGLAESEHLTTVHLWHLCSGDLAHLQTLPNLAAVTLVQNDCADIDLSKLALLPRLTYLQFSSYTITARQLEQIAQIKGLNSLHFRRSKMDEPACEALRLLATLPKLQILAINGATDETANVVANIESLTYLGFENARLTDVGAAALAKLRNLRDLQLVGCEHPIDIQTDRKSVV